MATQSLVMSVPEACAELRIGKTTLYTLINANRLRTVKIGRATRITTESVRGLVGEAVPAAPANAN